MAATGQVNVKIDTDPRPAAHARLDETPAGLMALAAMRSGLTPPHVQQAQTVLDRAVVGGFFDRFEGQELSTTLDAVLYAARDLLAGQFGDVTVHIVWDQDARTTRLVVGP